MIPTIDRRQDTTHQEHTEVKPPFLFHCVLDLCNDIILKNPVYIDCFCINFPCHYVLDGVDLDTNLLDIALLWKNFLRPTIKPRSVGPHKSKPEKTTSKKKSHLKNKKFRSVSTQLYEEPKSVKIQTYESAESRSGEETMMRQCLFNTDEDPKNLSCINSGASIPISTCKFTKNRSYIDSSAFIPISTYKFTMFDHSKDITVEAYEELKNSCSHYSGNDQLFKVDVESACLPTKDTELFYCHVARLLFANKKS